MTARTQAAGAAAAAADKEGAVPPDWAAGKLSVPVAPGDIFRRCDPQEVVSCCIFLYNCVNLSLFH